MSTVNAIIEFLNLILPIITGLIILANLTPTWHYPPKTLVVLFVIAAFISLIINIGLFVFMGMDGHSKYITAIFNLSYTLIVYMLLVRQDLGKMLFTIFSCFAFIFCLSCLGEILGGTSTILRMFIRIVAFLIILPLICKYFRVPFFQITNELRGRWLYLIPLPVTICVLCFLLLVEERIFNDFLLKSLAFVLCVLTFGIYVAMFYVFQSLKSQYEEQADYSRLKEQILSLQKQINTINESNEKLSIFHHDMRHYIHIIHSALDKSDIPAVRAILSSMSSTLTIAEKNKPRVYTGNLLLDSVLGNYESVAAERGIHFVANITLNKVMEDDPLDLAIVIANGLENAIHACEKLPNSSKREIHITGLQSNQQYFLSMDNTFDGNADFQHDSQMPCTSESGHGFGTKSISAFARRKNAILSFSTEDNWFKVRLIF